VALAAALLPGLASATTDPFYQYTGSTPLADLAPGTVLKSREISVYIASIKTTRKATQLVYRSTDALKRPSANVTTIFTPDCRKTNCANKNKVVSYQSAYDSLNPEDAPSRAYAGGKRLPLVLPAAETALFGKYLVKGYTVVVPDTEGQTANFGAGPEYGYNTLDSLRAALNGPQIGLSRDAKIVMFGYSGGAIATEWAAELAPSYAPDLKPNLIGATMGGVLVSPNHNLDYVNGAVIWGGVMPMAVLGIARSYEIDIEKYLSPRGQEVFQKMQKASILYVLGQYRNVKWTDLVKPEFSDRSKIPEYVAAANKLIMGTGGTPEIPLQIVQGAGGFLEGTKASPIWGKGDGVMLAADVRTLARQYCEKGVPVQYKEHALASHVGAALLWLPGALSWMDDRFAGKPAPQNCSSIAPGNPLTPLTYKP
jgi:hypothetical protein